MSWRPTTDFEEEIVNFQPDHDFIFAALSEPEPQPFYPRPQSHIDYAATKKRQAKKQQEEYEATGKFNDRLHVISEVQRIAGTKPLGEQASVNDWDTDKDVETEVVAMMRHFGMGPSVEQPLNEKVTVATYPVKNGVEVMQNGRKKVPLLFNNSLFKLKPKVLSSSSMSNESPSYNSSQTNNNSSNEEEEGDSFHTPSYHDISLTTYDKARIDRQTFLLQAERMHQYDKLKDDSLDDEITSTSSNNQDSFKTANTENTTCSTDLNNSYLSSQSSDFIPSTSWYRRNSSQPFSNSFDQHSSYSTNSTKESPPRSKTSSFLQRFIISDESSESKASTSLNSSTASSTPILPLTYANVAKKLVRPPPKPLLSLSKSATTVPLDNVLKLSKIPQSQKLRFYTAREVYNMKRAKAAENLQ